MQGFVMGGGVGVSVHGSHRVVGETTQVAMPECMIGLVPDIGASAILARAPGRLGEYLGVTGYRMGPGDAIHAGFADHFVPEARWPDLAAALTATGDARRHRRASRSPPPKPPSPPSQERDRRRLRGRRPRRPRRPARDQRLGPRHPQDPPPPVPPLHGLHARARPRRPPRPRRREGARAASTASPPAPPPTASSSKASAPPSSTRTAPPSGATTWTASAPRRSPPCSRRSARTSSGSERRRHAGSRRCFRGAVPAGFGRVSGRGSRLRDQASATGATTYRVAERQRSSICRRST